MKRQIPLTVRPTRGMSRPVLCLVQQLEVLVFTFTAQSQRQDYALRAGAILRKLRLKLKGKSMHSSVQSNGMRIKSQRN